MSRFIAYQITDEYEMMVDDGEFDTSAAANEWLWDRVQGEAIGHFQSSSTDFYSFHDGSGISFKGDSYRVEVGV